MYHYNLNNIDLFAWQLTSLCTYQVILRDVLRGLFIFFKAVLF